jgi:hypothetical protein
MWAMLAGIVVAIVGLVMGRNSAGLTHSSGSESEGMGFGPSFSTLVGGGLYSRSPRADGDAAGCMLARHQGAPIV